MRPILFEIGSIPVYSYGLMMAIAFLVADYILGIEFKRKKINANFANEITILAVVFGILGAKLLFLFENFNDFIKNPIDMAFSAGGLTWYGGFILAFIVIFLYVRKKNLPTLKVLDSIAPGVAIGYGIGRIGCHLSGDGDYGIPTDLPWGTVYANGTLKPSVALREFFVNNPQLAEKYDYWNLSAQVVRVDKFGVVTKFDEVIRLHPTPIYEFLIMLGIFGLLLYARKFIKQDGQLFVIYLIFASIERFFIEFLRLNPRLILGLSEAQIISVLIFAAGWIWLLKSKGKRN